MTIFGQCINVLKLNRRTAKLNLFVLYDNMHMEGIQPLIALECHRDS